MSAAQCLIRFRSQLKQPHQMLFRIKPLRHALLGKSKYLFGGAHHAKHDSHDHHDGHGHGHGHGHYEVHLNTTDGWIQNAHPDPALRALYGFKDTQPFHEPHDYPFPHLVNAPIWSLDYGIFHDAFHHEEDHDALYNEPHGYLFGDDPLDSRYNMSIPAMAVFGMTLIGFFFVTVGDNYNFRRRPFDVLFEHLSEIDEFDSTLDNLKKERQQLLGELAELQGDN